ncbi:aspartate carbamoyltransferase regulatory subunit [Echinimonas agarilytica]|uniref:Aspartate carbamoyltransferase regulatory chain n=1 Tax=Echinimonas agarilytica TaxID=1215918 RepID=A0AA41W7F1_9GAMM|nr:aspartate carbamoyltransferase regulatory subunit [Echinimonas agarilytica]MCM2679873.1 aspartate carbamoyltransferase regulatory subunit [Echinimonas agarilytica]
MAEHKLQVEAIERGTVIDHIPAGMGIRILKFFQLTQQQDAITVGLNLRSKHSSSKKDIIKVENTIFDVQQANQLALFAKDATINVIDDYDVVEKYQVTLPEAVIGVLTCPNSNCICHDEPVDSRFYVTEDTPDVTLKCHYCEKSFSQRLFVELK